MILSGRSIQPQPNTGGERLLWLIIGLILLAGGTTVVVTSRNREDATS